nr:hypothetical protein [Tanacetum cinerariifolium]
MRIIIHIIRRVFFVVIIVRVFMRFNSIYYDDDDDDDDEESTIPFSDIISQLPPSIVIINSPLVLSIEDPEDPEVYFIMRNEELNIIPEKESDEFIKSSVRDLVPIPTVSPFLISFGSEDTIFEPGISAFHFSHRSGTFICFNVYLNVLNESSMEIFFSTRFSPNITMIWGESS